MRQRRRSRGYQSFRTPGRDFGGLETEYRTLIERGQANKIGESVIQTHGNGGYGYGRSQDEYFAMWREIEQKTGSMQITPDSVEDDNKHYEIFKEHPYARVRTMPTEEEEKHREEARQREIVAIEAPKEKKKKKERKDYDPNGEMSFREFFMMLMND